MAAERLALDTITIRQAGLEDKFRLAAAAGFQGLELWHDEIAPSPRRIVRLAEHYGLAIGGVCPGPKVYAWDHRWTDDLGRLFAERLPRYAETGARYIVLPVMSEEGDLAQIADNLYEVCRLAEPHGLAVGLEPIGHVRRLSRFADAFRIVREVGGNAGLVLDAFHFFRGRNDLAVLDTVDPGAICAVHLDDAMDLPLDALVGYRHRLYPGRGIFDVQGFVTALMRAGYRGAWTVELLNAAYWEDDPREVARTAYRTARAILAGAARAQGDASA